VQGKPIELTQVEFKLLFTLMTKPGNVYAREILMSHSYDDGRIVSHRTIDSHIKNLRNKITAIDATNNLIHSIYGVGYKIE
jgi:two-component system, OmpR family, response regulator BaeR